MAAVQDSSSHWRQQGNVFYTGVREGLCFTVSRERLSQAYQCYQKAFHFGKTDDDLASASKNLAMTGWKMMKLMSSSREHSFLNAATIIYYCKEAFKHFSYSYNQGQKVKSPDWLTGILTSARACWQDVLLNYINDLEYDVRVQALFDLVQAVEMDCIKSECYLKLADCQFHRGILALQNSDYKKCLSAMRDCFMPIEETIRLTKDDYILTEAKVLESDVFMHLSMAESIQARAIGGLDADELPKLKGDELFDKVLMDEESLNIDMVWEVIDWYKQATLRTREVTEVELEAIALSRIGRVYDKVLKLQYRAKEYYKHAIQLAFSMHPRTFNTEDWFKEATEMVAKYQSESVQAEQERERLEKMETLKDLETEIKQLKEYKDKNVVELLTFVYKTFPPKDEKKKLELPKTEERDKMKKCLQTAVVHYHPDSIDAEKYGKKWKVLCEEITKVLTQRYECYKG